jgi:polysaccharide export outer membrane protein
MRVRLPIVLIFAVMVTWVTGGAWAQDTQQPVYTLGSGDKVRVTVFNEEDLSGEFEVSGEGGISLPMLGSIDVKGKNLRQVERDIEALLRDGFLKNPRVSIDVLNYRPFYILGEVKKPGSYPYVNGMTVLNAVALGGGFTYRAKEDKITIIRATDRERKPQTVTPETVVLPGDVVRVEERFF